MWQGSPRGTTCPPHDESSPGTPREGLRSRRVFSPDGSDAAGEGYLPGGPDSDVNVLRRMHAFTQRTDEGLACRHCGVRLSDYIRWEPRPRCEDAARDTGPSVQGEAGAEGV